MVCVNGYVCRGDDESFKFYVNMYMLYAYFFFDPPEVMLNSERGRKNGRRN